MNMALPTHVIIKVFLILVILSCKIGSSNNQTSLDLSNQGLNQLPDSVLGMKKLEFLNLGNDFTLYPPLSALGENDPSIGNGANQLTELPQEITRLKKLRTLDIVANNLEDLPKDFHQLKKLDTLSLAFNPRLELSQIMEIAKMPGLKYLNIIGIPTDSISINKLKKALPNTKVILKFDELEFTN